MAVKTVAVIGAGASGLAAIKCCLDEGLEPTCFEKSEDIGGLWRYKDHSEDDRASIYKSVIINTSKEMMCFSDFPIPEHFPNYMHNSKIMEYFRMYAEKFDLLNYIQFKTTVCSIKRSPKFSATGQWIVTTEKEDKQDVAVFDAVMICTGHHTFPNLPLYSFPGIENFKGQYLHSRDYKIPDSFKDKRIVVIGIGNSGGDIAVELSRMAQQVFLSTRRGAWIVNRVSVNGYPVDIAKISRFTSLLQKALPTVLNYITEKAINNRCNHGNYGLLPQHRYNSQHPTVNDDLPNRIISGFVQIRPNIKAFTDTGVIFEDGTKEENIDAVIFATGYSFSFPFCEESVINVKGNKIALYKFMFPYHLEKPTLAIVGLIQPIGAIMPISELQSRLATQVFKGLVQLPSKESMTIDIVYKKYKMSKRYVESQRHTIQVDYVEYMDELATLAGVKPNIFRAFFTDPWLALHVFFGPCTPYQYRLTGPGKWSGAREAILTQWKRIIKPTQTRVLENSTVNMSIPLMLIVCAALIVLTALFLHF
ncbi:flavin-containing monooxygenase 5-like [Bufo gargarizans]|uniref:flavin-containing monooxygenase 5-like n=1 Tax=Bufo gargarizans TaxID=30331 RepID=UPI001CF2F859|nr:flavin-containing monooxygenase 5-like [Bufo gargarizans]XP_044156765.1 flavin-containing monooxygenase 5-like [Bufo gargarizans]